MNYIIANGICCCLQCCCKEIFQTLYKLIGKTSFIKSMYFVIYAAFVIILLGAFVFLRDWSFFMSYVAQGIHCNDSTDFDCITVSLVYRIVTSVAIFIIFILVVMSLCTTRVSHILNEGLFFSKFVFITIIFILLLQFDNSLYQHLSSLYQYVSYVFLLCQGIITVDLGYLWGVRWAEKYSSGQSSKYGCLLIGFTIVMFAIALGLNVTGYIIVADEHDHMFSIGTQPQCSNLPNILNTIFIIGCVGVQLLNFNKQNSLLTTSFVCVYISFWSFSSIYSSSKCNLTFQSASQSQNHKHYQKSQFYLIGTVFSVFWLLLSTFGSIFGSTNKFEDSTTNESGHHIEYIQLGQQNNRKPKNMSQQSNTEQNSSENVEYTDQNKKNWLIWHFFMLTMIVYLSMVLSDWGSGNLITKKFSLNQNAYWSKIVMAIFTFLIYIWTLVAPKLFPDRNFYYV